MNELVHLRKMKPGLPIVVCGDMNSNRKSLVREYLLHGMPEVNKDGDVVLPADGPFSGVWSREFNKKMAREPDGTKSTWKNDSYPWRHLWYNGAESPFRGKSAELVALRDAFEDLHDGKLAYVAPFPHCIIVTLWPGTLCRERRMRMVAICCWITCA